MMMMTSLRTLRSLLKCFRLFCVRNQGG